MFGSVVSVLVPVPLDGPFDYRLDHGEPPAPGTHVVVPFAGRELIGVVWDEPPARTIPTHRLKSIAIVLDAPPMPQAVRALVSEVAQETLAPRGAVLKLALSVPAGLEPWPEKLAYRRAAGEPPNGSAVNASGSWPPCPRTPPCRRPPWPRPPAWALASFKQWPATVC